RYRKCKRFTLTKYCWQHHVPEHSYLDTLPKDLILELALFLPYMNAKQLCDNDTFWTRYYNANYSTIHSSDLPPIKQLLEDHATEYDEETDNLHKFMIAGDCGWTIKMEQLLPYVNFEVGDWNACLYAYGIVPRRNYIIDFLLSKVPQCREHILTILQFATVVADLTILSTFKNHITDKKIYNEM